MNEIAIILIGFGLICVGVLAWWCRAEEGRLEDEIDEHDALTRREE